EATVAANDDSLHLKRLPPGENPDNFEVELRDLPARTVAYIRVLNPYHGTSVVDATQRLIQWAEQRGVAHGQWLGYMWDNPEIVPVEDCRYDMAVVMDSTQLQPEGEVSVFHFSAMHVAQIEVRGGIDLELRALDWFYSTWLPTSGYVPDDQPSFEAFIGRPFAHGFEYFELQAQLPLRREG
ncbi:MAG: AraC family transcriptional regulator, partial [Pseudohongiellaceae bacterium]